LNRRTAGLIAVAIAAVLLTVGLWPFAFRLPNRVNWLKDRAGLSFQPDGIAYDPKAADWSGGGPPNQPAAFTMELWLEPGHVPATDLFDILTIDDGGSPPEIMLFQWRTELLLRVRDGASQRGSREVGPSGVLTEQTRRFITVTVDPAGTSFYSNGSLLKYYPGFTLPNSQLNGRLILGNAAEGKHPWTGNLFGLAIFNRTLDASEVAQHYALWTNHQAGQLAAESGLAALYCFDEGNGQWANDLSIHRHRLLIPERYEVLRKRVLELDPIGMSDLDDIAVNILGFMPFGFIVYRYRRLAKPDGRGWNIAWAVCAGATISLAIELTQAWLPNRSSSINDLITNTLGTFLGALLARKMQPRTTPARNTSESKPG
jgi:VanZ like protein/concanavalin A-like lectin/glucanase superfamily protein